MPDSVKYADTVLLLLNNRAILQNQFLVATAELHKLKEKISLAKFDDDVENLKKEVEKVVTKFEEFANELGAHTNLLITQ